jgi:hypothetical protein
MGHPSDGDAADRARLKAERTPSSPDNLRTLCWKSVCAQGQVFRKNCVNSSANAQQKGRSRAPFRKFLMEIFRYKF